MDVHTFDEIAWAAGLFEGEGSITGSGGRLDVRVKMTDEPVVRRFAEVMDCGTVYGPYNYEYRDGCKRKPHWIWVAVSYEAFEVLQILWPWLGDRRRAQALAVAWLWLGPSEITVATVKLCGPVSLPR